MKVEVKKVNGTESVVVTAGAVDLVRLAHVAQDTANDGEPRGYRVEVAGKSPVEVRFERGA